MGTTPETRQEITLLLRAVDKLAHDIPDNEGSATLPGLIQHMKTTEQWTSWKTRYRVTSALRSGHLADVRPKPVHVDQRPLYLALTDLGRTSVPAPARFSGSAGDSSGYAQAAPAAG